ncbi:hypothetical protein [Marimonas arenosa]|uniref:Transglycosylase associated protein n=1 Tax=Marimonas arenosa TaxID=1795305 RepID=A0AAE3WDU5_9RHOB|nr:hypothetical protein [Marimonas arenosa]MDQ2090749.1 hypothetical protein [Marimonas arenosa]
MTIFVSAVIGLIAGCFVNYAITLRTGKARNFVVCIVGAFLGGALIPSLISISGFWSALIGSVLGVLVLLWITFRLVVNPIHTSS